MLDPLRGDRPVAGLGRADPALLVLGGNDSYRVVRSEKRADQLVEKDGRNPVVVRYE
jgi:hypothetical protein